MGTTEHSTPAISTETITLGGGCFWCVDAALRAVPGVLQVECGYSNGLPHIRPDYESVCTGQTGYAEVVRVVFDPLRISLLRVLELFFAIHDPTSLNRQGNDVGTQYRSAVFVHSAKQQEAVLQVMRDMEERGQFDRPLVTEVESERDYWPAEGYHQDFYNRHPGHGYCQVVIRPKLQKVEQLQMG